MPLIGGELVCAVADELPARFPASNSANTPVTILFIPFSPLSGRGDSCHASGCLRRLYLAEATTSSPLSSVLTQPCAAMDLMISFAVASAVFEAYAFTVFLRS